MSDLSKYRDNLYKIDEYPDRLKSIELLLIRIVGILDLIILRMDAERKKST